jgi:pyruvate dehydrogenase E2 component (dihydrolipoamide acetyltransferase)
MESGSIAAWNIAEGASFIAGDVFCSVETDKAVVDFEAQDDGVLAKILVPAASGVEIACGAPIMITVDDVAHVTAFANYTVEASATPIPPPSPAAAAPEPVPVAIAVASPPPPIAAAPATTGSRVVASPLAITLAKEQGHDLSQIVGTGPHGRIIAADVQEFVPSAATTAAVSPVVSSTPSSPPIMGTGFTDYPVSDAARAVAAQLVQSKRNVPHYYLTVDITLDAVLALRSQLNEGAEVEIGVYEFCILAAAKSMSVVPTVNASWLDSVVRVYEDVHLNIVMGAGDDLRTPVISFAQRQGLQALSQSLAGLDAAENEIGTFTMVNVGMYGVKSVTPIIREPQACALGLGAITTRIVPKESPADENDIYQESQVMTATLSCDHRVVDGAVGAQWLAAFKSYLEKPTTLLL